MTTVDHLLQTICLAACAGFLFGGYLGACCVAAFTIFAGWIIGIPDVRLHLGDPIAPFWVYTFGILLSVLAQQLEGFLVKCKDEADSYKQGQSDTAN